MSIENNDDVFEEFDFKPITEGLGFQKKAINLKKEVATSGLTDRQLMGSSRKIPTATSLLNTDFSSDEIDNSDVQFTEDSDVLLNVKEKRQLLADQKVEIKQPILNDKKSYQINSNSEPTFDQKIDRKFAPNFKSNLDLNFTENTESNLNNLPSLDREILRKMETDVIEYKVVSSNMVSALFDGVVALVFAIIFSVSMMMVTKVDLLEVLLSDRNQLMIQGSLLAMYFVVLTLYIVISRVVAGSTLGEWAFDVHLSQKNDQQGKFFPLLVIWRSVVNFSTGVVVLPILSFIIRKDLLSFFTGTKLYQQK